MKSKTIYDKLINAMDDAIYSDCEVCRATRLGIFVGFITCAVLVVMT